jgi:carboxyl-terminal processing protease
LAVTLLLLTSSSWLPASTPALPPGSLAPSARERMIARQVGSTLEESHFSRTKIDDRMSSRIMDKFLDALDGQRSYLLAADIAEFEPQRMRFDDMIRTGDIEPAYAMFARFQQRNRERIRYAIGLLEREPDFALDERFEFDREHTPWAKSTAELDDLWRKRVKNDAIALMLAGKNWTEAREVLRTRYERVLKRVDQIKPEEVFETVIGTPTRALSIRTPAISRRAIPRNTRSRCPSITRASAPRYSSWTSTSPS